MFDIAWSELLVIGVVALIFIGPKELPAVLFKLGQAVSKLRLTVEGYRRQFEASMREAGLEDIHRNIHELKSLNPASQIKDTLSRTLTDETFSAPLNTPASAAYTANEVTQPLPPTAETEQETAALTPSQAQGPDHAPAEERAKPVEAAQIASAANGANPAG